MRGGAGTLVPLSRGELVAPNSDHLIVPEISQEPHLKPFTSSRSLSRRPDTRGPASSPPRLDSHSKTQTDRLGMSNSALAHTRGVRVGDDIRVRAVTSFGFNRRLQASSIRKHFYPNFDVVYIVNSSSLTTVSYSTRECRIPLSPLLGRSVRASSILATQGSQPHQALLHQATHRFPRMPWSPSTTSLSVPQLRRSLVDSGQLCGLSGWVGERGLAVGGMEECFQGVIRWNRAERVGRRRLTSPGVGFV
jgi:hypothetical protein